MNAVSLILTPDACGELKSLSERMHVWAVESPGHRAIAGAVWAEQSTDRQGFGLTLFKADPREAADDICHHILPVIDLHHGELSEDPPYQAILVVGCPLSERLRSTFSEFGFSEFTLMDNGFQARRPST